MIASATEHRPLGGVRDLEGLRLRCYCDEDTGCWHWRHAFTTGRVGTKTPVTYLPALGRVVSAFRAAVMLSRGMDCIPAGHFVWPGCNSRDCVNPAHLRIGTQKALGKHVARKGWRKNNPLRIAAIQKQKRSATTMTDEVLADIRESKETLAVLSERHGISKTHASRIRRGDAWKVSVTAPEAPGASIFNWRP